MKSSSSRFPARIPGKLHFLFLILACLAALSIACQSSARGDKPPAKKEAKPQAVIETVPPPAVKETEAPVVQQKKSVPPTDVPAKPATSEPAAPRIQEASFSSSSWSQEVPDDILEQLGFFGQGGGGGEYCIDEYSEPAFMSDLSGETYELFNWVFIVSCGWQEGETVRQTITYPNGRVEKEERSADGFLEIDVDFRPNYGDPSGTYTLRLEGQSGSLATTFKVVEPDEARFVTLDQSTILFYKFSPRETVRLLVYENGYLFAWQTLQVGQDGNLLVHLDLPEDRYFSFYTIGEVTQIPGYEMVYFDCPGTLRPRVVNGGAGRVTFTDGKPLNVRSEPGYSATVLTKIPEGTEVWLMDGPVCADSSVWWKIYAKDDIEGWVSEGKDGVYYLEPQD